MDKQSEEYKRLFKKQEERIKKAFSNEVVLLDIEFINEDTCYIKDATFTLRHNCDKCNYSTYKRKANSLYKRKTVGCPNCKDINHIKEWKLNQLNESLIENDMVNYSLLDIRKETNNTHWIMKLQHSCSSCNNHIFEVRTDNCFTNGNRCPICSRRNANGKSYGEEKIVSILNDMKIHYIKGHYEENLNLINALYDFKVQDILIEYDGSPHFKESFNDPMKLVKQNITDRKKTQYCIDNDIPILRIPYIEFNNLEEILSSILIYEDVHFKEYDILFINHKENIAIYNSGGIYAELIKDLTF